MGVTYLTDGSFEPNDECITKEEWLREKLWEDYVDTMLMKEEEEEEDDGRS